MVVQVNNNQLAGNAIGLQCHTKGKSGWSTVVQDGVKLENDDVTAQFTGYLADGFEQTINDFDEHFNDTTADWRNLHVVN